MILRNIIISVSALSIIAGSALASDEFDFEQQRSSTSREVAEYERVRLETITRQATALLNQSNPDLSRVGEAVLMRYFELQAEREQQVTQVPIIINNSPVASTLSQENSEVDQYERVRLETITRQATALLNQSNPDLSRVGEAVLMRYFELQAQREQQGTQAPIITNYSPVTIGPQEEMDEATRQLIISMTGDDPLARPTTITTPRVITNSSPVITSPVNSNHSPVAQMDEETRQLIISMTGVDPLENSQEQEETRRIRQQRAERDEELLRQMLENERLVAENARLLQRLQSEEESRRQLLDQTSGVDSALARATVDLERMQLENQLLRSAVEAARSFRYVEREDEIQTTVTGSSDTQLVLPYQRNSHSHTVPCAIQNGQSWTETAMIYDTGASITCIPQSRAAAFGINVGALRFDQQVGTGNGTTMGAYTTINLRVGQIATLNNLRVLVLPNLEEALFGRNAISKFRQSGEGDRLTLSRL